MKIKKVNDSLTIKFINSAKSDQFVGLYFLKLNSIFRYRKHTFTRDSRAGDANIAGTGYLSSRSFLHSNECKSAWVWFPSLYRPTTLSFPAFTFSFGVVFLVSIDDHCQIGQKFSEELAAHVCQTSIHSFVLSQEFEVVETRVQRSYSSQPWEVEVWVCVARSRSKKRAVIRYCHSNFKIAEHWKNYWIARKVLPFQPS